jgi:predicted extracellular nuclease
MTYKSKILSIILMSIVSISMTHAANVILKDGSSYQGEIKSQNSETLVMDVNGIEMRIPTASVSTIDLQGTAVQTTTAAKTTTATSTSTAAANSTGPVTVSAGTALTVRMMESINSRNNKTGQRFTAQLETNLMSGDTVVAPKGAKVYGVLTNVKKAGRIAGSAAMTFELRDISIDDVMVAIRTQPVSGEGKNTAKSSVGRTARAAAIGGLIDGSDGAKTGAKVGVGAAILTKGDDIELPKGTLVDFILAAPLER